MCCYLRIVHADVCVDPQRDATSHADVTPVSPKVQCVCVCVCLMYEYMCAFTSAYVCLHHSDANT